MLMYKGPLIPMGENRCWKFGVSRNGTGRFPSNESSGGRGILKYLFCHNSLTFFVDVEFVEGLREAAGVLRDVKHLWV